MQFCEKKTGSPDVAILMATYNAGKYLAQQLDSFEMQKYQNWRLYVSDDNSRDDTLSLLQTYRNKWGDNKLNVFPGPCKGFSANFLSLVCNPDIRAEFYAYSDQDDIWENDKISCAIETLSRVDENVPALYCARTLLVDEINNEIGYSACFKKKPCIKNAMVQSIAGGNTMVINNAARQLLLNAGIVDVVSHDWWTYLVVTACGGQVFYDECAHVRYRQHAKNLVGSNSGILQKVARAKMLCSGDFSLWVEKNLNALARIEKNIPEKQLKLIRRFKKIRKSNVFSRTLGIISTGLYRQTLLGNLGLYFAFLFKKI
ncbi:TPA: glycosyltransferase family 2 protein [Escherichia coli]|uniref:glycosyltransferase family 2 protein n=2 Tax=Escherichia coli TaxID=562 RepID=UPI000F886460|nr:glycosyltransferase family 2 protein [Escherichia coli]EFC6641729.1 glycosyltransferase family 2 protein [Escherichia coli]EIA1388157.1 glycosyltransferase family 2 protein [Escherichia coli]EIQ0035118.1 glycosyltransferase family 2 protein [Escherichia coli]EJE7555480.1 glycosyltransferase family 2 protein [Escherichia coli]EJN8568029.1 glycosyltransferase family 2 protein [Escherichia coli]